MKYSLRITSRYPKYEVKRIVRQAYDFVFNGQNKTPSNLFRIWIRNSSRHAFSGRFYGHKMSVKVGKPESFPVNVKYPGLKTAPEYTFNDWQEAMFGVTVHELYHKLQDMTGSGYSEIETERRTVVGLEQFRMNRTQFDVSLEPQKHKEKERTVRKDNPNLKLEKIEGRIKVWQRKLKLAQTKLKKLNKKRNYLAKKGIVSTVVAAITS